MTNSNRKGKRGELELKDELTRLFGVECRRGQQYSGIEGEDVVGLPGIHVECKRTEKLSLYQAMSQAVEDASEGCIPLVCHRRSRNEWLAIVRLDDLPALAEKLHLILASDGGEQWKVSATNSWGTTHEEGPFDTKKEAEEKAREWKDAEPGMVVSVVPSPEPE